MGGSIHETSHALHEFFITLDIAKSSAGIHND